MKIAILSPFYPFRGGLAQLNAHLYRQLAKNSETEAFSFTTLYPKFLFPGKTQLVQDNDQPDRIASQRVLNSINPFSYIATAKAINSFAPHFLIIPYWMSFLAPAFGTVCRFLNKKTRVIALVHNAIPHEKRFFDKSFARYFFKRCFAFIVMSDTVKNDLLNLIPRAKIIQLHHPIYQQYKPRYDRQTACQNLNIEAEKRNILFFGLIRRYKGLDILIDAFGKLNSSNYQLLVAGECYGDFQPYREQIDALPNRENVKVWEEYIPDDMVTTLFSAADLLVLPYREATQSGVTALAIQLETPMIGTNAGSLGEYIQRSGTGMAVEKNSADALAQAIAEFFRGDKRAEYAQNLKKEKELLSWDSFGEKLQNFLEESLPHSADEN